VTKLPDDPARALLVRLSGMSAARIGLGRAGQGLPTSAMLDFQLAHARARDAVHAALDRDALAAQVGDVTLLESSADDRAHYLRDPDSGRRLSAASAERLADGACDLAVVIGDGLSALAVVRHAAAVVAALRGNLPGEWRMRVFAAQLARVALGDEIGERTGARAVLMLIGERPGLSAADSLGAYLTWSPRRGMRDAQRNCISNIRAPGGLSPPEAARRIAWLLREAEKLGETGVRLKDRSRERELPPG
jgi:ethanolamine ammonia-lyase small subunit